MPGLDVRQDGDVIRIDIPADKLFKSGTSNLMTSAAPLLDQVADSIGRNYRKQRIGIEGHTDNAPIIAPIPKRPPTNCRSGERCLRAIDEQEPLASPTTLCNVAWRKHAPFFQRLPRRSRTQPPHRSWSFIRRHSIRNAVIISAVGQSQPRILAFCYLLIVCKCGYNGLSCEQLPTVFVLPVSILNRLCFSSMSFLK